MRTTFGSRRRKIAACVLAALGMGQPLAVFAQWNPYSNPSPASRAVAPASPDSPFYWPRSELTIPFEVDPAGKLPKAIHLEISNDDGRSWMLYAKSDLSSSSFHVRSDADGAYLFRVKTFDENGQAFPSQDPPYRVVIDTHRPTGDLNVDVDPIGRMVADFRISDENLKADSLRLEYQTELQSRWVPIELEIASPATNDIWGRGFFELPQSAKRVMVRLIAADQAGNALELTRFPEILRTAGANGGMILASQKARATSPFGNGNARPEAGPSIQLSEVNRNAAPSAANPLNRLKTPAPITSNPGAVATIEIPAGSRDVEQNIPFPTRTSATKTLSTKPGSNYSLRELSPEEWVRTNGPGQLVSQSDSGLIIGSMNAAQPTLNVGDAGGVELTIPNQRADILTGNATNSNPNANVISVDAGDASNLRAPIAAREWLRQMMRTTELPYFSNSLAFSLDYEIDADARANVAAVDLWGTIDGGKTWERWSQDADGQSPFDIKVQSEGLFGFRMVLVGRNGLMSNRPQDGEQPDVWVMVDTKTPTAKITSAEYGRGTETGMLVIEYFATDEFASERPVSFSYAPTQDGPWTTVASGLPNTGHYAWPPDPSLPYRIFLRIEFTDMAGNTAINRLDVPIDVQGLAPRGRINGFRPIKS